MPTAKSLLSTLLFIFASATFAGAADAIIHNNDTVPYQCDESWAHIKVVIHYSGLVPGFDTVIANADHQEILTFQPTAASGTETRDLADAHAVAAGHTYGVPYTIYFYAAAYAAQSYFGAPNLFASGGREIIGLAVDENFPAVGCPWAPAVRNDVTLEYTVSNTAPPIAPGAELKRCDVKVGGDQQTCSGCNSVGMARYTIHEMLVSLNIEDTPIQYSPPYGPSLGFTVTYNQRDAQQPATFNYSNLGPKWTFNWLAYVVEDPNSQLPLTKVYMPGGGAEVFAYLSGAFTIDPQSHAQLVKVSAGVYERLMPDGSKYRFAQSDGASKYPRRIFLTEIHDAAGNKATIEYDNKLRVVKIKDAALQETSVSYEAADPYKITKVTESGPSPRFATFEYDSAGRLYRITDEIGIQSTFGYEGQSDFINSMTTPYGPTTFEKGESATNRWIEATDPELGKERVEYRDNVAGNWSNEPVPDIAGLSTVDLGMHNTYYWSKKATTYPGATADYTKAEITHWLLNADDSVSAIPASTKKQLENRVWFTYEGQTDKNHVGPSANPSIIARVLADNSTQTSRFMYNDLGKTTQAIDPVGRVTAYEYYDNHIDLHYIRQTTGTNNELLREFPSYDKHKPTTEFDEAHQPTTYSYNANGQLLTRTNAKTETTSYAYGDGSAGHPQGYLQSITSPAVNGVSAVSTFTYDSHQRVRTVTNSDNYTVTTDYDNLDRKIKVTYPDTTFEEFSYVDDVRGMTLDLTASRDRRGLWTYRKYDGNQHMTSIEDPEHRFTQYGWCTCGSLTSIEDPNHNVTTFNRDIQSRVYEKVYEADQTKITYLYEGQTAPNSSGATSRLKSSTDAKNQQTNYLYTADGNVQQVSYTNAFLPTATVNYVYDPNYNRVTSMTDGIGATNYTYYSVVSGTLGAGKLHTTSGPLPNSTITLAYDELGRVISQNINGTSATMAYDSLGRADTTTNALGSFTRTYDGVTPRLKTLDYPNGQHSLYSYFDNLHDRRLKRIKNVFGTPPSLTTLLSQHDYTYDATGQIQTWNKVLGDDVTNLSFGYDDADQLTSVYNGRTQFSYEYDPAGNRLIDGFYTPGRFAQHGGNFYTANTLNQLDTVSRDPGYGFASGPFPIAYDADGNMTDDGANRTFEWDAANRLVAINYKDAGSRTEFAYDGLGRRVKILEYDGSTAATIEPGSGGMVSQYDRNNPNGFETFTVGPFSGPTGNYTLLFQGLNPNGGLNAMLVDAVALDGTVVTGGSFESPTVEDYQYRPVDMAWTYGGSTGIAAGGGTFMAFPPAADGVQSAFIERNGSLWQTFNLAAGTHSFSFRAAQARNVNESTQQVRVSVLGLPTNTKTFVWSGNTIAEERDSSGMVVAKRFFPEGEQRVGGVDAGNYYYSRDHLGSIREATNASGAVKAQYDYDAWGNQVVVTGNMSFDFGYTGHYRHAPSNLYLAEYRAYDPTMARWISRDPIGNPEILTSLIVGRGASDHTPKAGMFTLEIHAENIGSGAHIYSYVGNRPIRSTDSTGLVQDDSMLIRAGPFPGPKNTRWCHLRRDRVVTCHIPRNPMLFAFCVSRAQAMMEIASALENDSMFDRGCSELAGCLNNYYD